VLEPEAPELADDVPPELDALGWESFVPVPLGGGDVGAGPGEFGSTLVSGVDPTAHATTIGIHEIHANRPSPIANLGGGVRHFGQGATFETKRGLR
jgi:hypothetical protein